MFKTGASDVILTLQEMKILCFVQCSFVDQRSTYKIQISTEIMQLFV